jgi:glycosyltransferase involved in cell wall biosynthesis
VRVVVISTSVFKIPCQGYAGLEQLAYLQAKGLAARGHEVAIVAPEGSTCEGCHIIPTGPAGQWDEKSTYEKYWHVLPDADVIIDNSWAKWAYILKQEGNLKAPVLGVMHAPVNTMYQTPPPVDKPCIVCISQDQANHWEALHSRKAEVAYNGVDPEFYKPLGIPRSNRFLFLARFSTVKSPHLAIEACKAAGVGLDLVGDTSITNEPDYLKHCQSMCDGKQIRMVGPASRSECVYWFSQAHALIHPNRDFREPFGLAPVEAMLCGTPVIAWDNGAMRETVKNNETGVLVTSVNDLVRSVQYYDQEKGYGVAPVVRQNCREWAIRFSVENMVTRYEELCHKAIETGGW